MNTTITIKAGKKLIEISVEMNKYEFCLTYNNGSIITNGYYSSNEKEIIMPTLLREFSFFEEEIELIITKLARKEKYIKK